MESILTLFYLDSNSLNINAWQSSEFAGAAFYICMALSGVTCSPPPPSATIEAIEAIEPSNDEDREGKPVLPLFHPSQHIVRVSTEATCHWQLIRTTAPNNNSIKQHFTRQFDAGMGGTFLCSTID